MDSSYFILKFVNKNWVKSIKSDELKEKKIFMNLILLIYLLYNINDIFCSEWEILSNLLLLNEIIK